MATSPTVVADPTPTSIPAAPAPVTSEPSQEQAAADHLGITANPADEARRKLYEKHYGAPPPQEAPAVPVAPAPTSEPTAQVVPPSEPVVAPAPAVLPPEYLQVLQAMQAQLAAVQAKLEPAAPAAPAAPAEDEPGWVSLLREGKIKEAEAALAKSAMSQVGPSLVDQAVARAREVARAEAEVETFVRDLKTANPELSIMEGFVTSEAQQRLAKVQASGTIKTTEDAVREYKKAVLDATELARNIARTLRGTGKTEAMTRSREVISASTPTPQQIVPREESPTQAANEPPTESLESYFEKRKTRETNLRNPYAPR